MPMLFLDFLNEEKMPEILSWKIVMSNPHIKSLNPEDCTERLAAFGRCV